MENLVEKWQELLEAEGVPEIVTSSKKRIVARILEEQEKDLISGGWMPEESLQEANVSGDAGNDADNIAAGKNSGNVVYPGPTVMGMVRRAIPQMMAFDTIGVQPLNQPTGQVFVIRSVYGKDKALGANGENEAFAPAKAPRVHWSGSASNDGSGDTPGAQPGDFTDVFAGGWAVDDLLAWGANGVAKDVRYFKATSVQAAAPADDAAVIALIASGDLLEVGEGIATSLAELMEGFNNTSGNAFNEMSFRIDKQGVEVKSRQLKAQYSIELAQDLRAVHGMDADAELSGILSNEILVDINREVVTMLNLQAQTGASGYTGGTATPGVFDITDSIDNKGARWAGEAYKSLLIQIEKEANEIGRQTGRGNGNWLLVSRNVASALSMTDVFVSAAQQGMQNGTMNTDTNNSVFAGVLGGRFRVYIDQYAVEDYVLVGFKGANEMEAGLFYSPYVPLTPLRGADSRNMQPVLAFKTRYALSINPFVEPDMVNQVFSGDSLFRGIGKNQYYRRFLVKGL